MDLFEYQGKQLFARYGIPVSAGDVAETVDEAVRAADAAGYPGRREGAGAGRRARQGGRHQARGERRRGAHRTPGTSSAWTSRATSCSGVWIEHASDIAEEYYASFTLDRGAKKYLGHAVARRAASRSRRSPRRTPTRSRASTIDPVDGLTEAACRAWVAAGEAEPGGDRRRGRHLVEAVPRVRRRRRRPGRDQPADPHARRQGARARRQGVARRERALPSSGVGRARRARRRPTRASSKRPRRVCSTSASTATSA